MILHKNKWNYLLIWDKKGWISRMYQILVLSKNYWARGLIVSILSWWHRGLSNEKSSRDTFILLKQEALEYSGNILQLGKQMFGLLAASSQEVFQCSLRGLDGHRISIGKVWDVKRLPHSTFPWCQLFLSLKSALLRSSEVVPQHLTSVPVWRNQPKHKQRMLSLPGAVINLSFEYCCKTPMEALWPATLQIVQTSAVSMFTPGHPSLRFAFEAHQIIPEKHVEPYASAPPPLSSQAFAGKLL